MDFLGMARADWGTGIDMTKNDYLNDANITTAFDVFAHKRRRGNKLITSIQAFVAGAQWADRQARVDERQRFTRQIYLADGAGYARGYRNGIKKGQAEARASAVIEWLESEEAANMFSNMSFLVKTDDRYVKMKNGKPIFRNHLDYDIAEETCKRIAAKLRKSSGTSTSPNTPAGDLTMRERK
jgi:hypothetical protein